MIRKDDNNMKNWQDPNAAVEAANYDNPIPSRVLILQTLLEREQATQHELATIFDLDDDEALNYLENQPAYLRNKN